MPNRQCDSNAVARSRPSSLASDEDELARAFPGREITHEFRIRSRADLGDVVSVLACLGTYGVSVDGLRLASAGAGHFHYDLKVKGIPPRAARALADKLAGLSGISDARVEHHLICA